MRRTWSVLSILVLVGGLLAACDKDEEPVCGNDVCEDGETAASCPSDCGGAVCGNGALDGTEACDGAALGTHTCATEGFASGTLACTNTCTLDTSACVAADCGNGTVEGNEACDGSDFDTHTCQSEGFFGGTLACTGTCTLDTLGCLTEGCGDDVKNGTEACDGEDLGTATCETLGHDGGTLACDAACAFVTTGCCENACPAADDLRCAGDVLEICTWGVGDCLEWQTEQNCAATDLICDDTGATPVCAPDCTDNCTTLDETRCMNDAVQTCEVAASGCQDWVETRDCTDAGNVCYALAAGAVCAAPCVNTCNVGDSRCTGQDVETCQADQYGCLGYVVDATCTPLANFCEVLGGDAQCVPNGTGESCTDVQVITAPFTLEGTDIAADFTNDATFTGTGCTTGSGVEAVLAIDLVADQTLRLVEASSGLDSVLRVLPSCDATAACLLSQDFGEGTPQDFVAPSDGRYIVVLEAYYADLSTRPRTYQLTVEVFDPETDCDDGVDNDEDGLTDCADPTCFGVAPLCLTETLCGDGEDNDADGLTDCDDPDCEPLQSCWTRSGQYETFSASSPNDLVGCTLTFTPAGGDYTRTYTCPGYAAFPITPGTGTVEATSFTLGDDDAAEYTLQGSWDVPFYGLPFASFHVGSNGYVTFGQEDTSAGTSFFARARVAGLMLDLDPEAGGTITVDEFADHVVVTYDAVVRYNGGGATVSFQITFQADGTIELTYLALGYLNGGSAGLSNGAAGTTPAAVDLVPAPPAIGEVFVTELMWNPAAVLDDDGEWIELRNVATVPRLLGGCTLVHAGATFTFPAGTLIPAGGYLVVVKNAVAAENGGVVGGVEWPGMVLGNSDGSAKDFVLTCATEIVDTLDFGAVPWPGGASGVAVQLERTFTTAAGNDLATAWCSAGPATYGAGDRGTPGAPNTFCGTPVLEADLETDPAWTLTGDWAWGTPAYGSGPATCAGGTGCYGTNLTGNYSTDMTYATNYLQVGPIDLSSQTGTATLHFDMWLRSESGYDYAQVQVSTDGVTFVPLAMAAPAYTHAATQQWSGSALNAWRLATADVTAYLGGTVYFRFALSSDDSLSYAGFYVDNVGLYVE